MKSRVLLITPPFTQLNTPYPATAYLKGFLNTKHIASHQADLGIEVILRLFSKTGLQQLFNQLNDSDASLSDNAYRIFSLREDYLQTIEPVIRFLQHKNPTLAHAICNRTYLPEASRFAALDDLEWAFGTMGTHDKARHLATLYLEDLGDFIQETTDEHFGFSRYAERLGRTATHFDELHQSLLAQNTIVSDVLWQLLDEKIKLFNPTVLGLSVPFPGNLFAAFKCAQFIKQHHPHIRVVLGGGFANTELRSLQDPRVFDFVDYVSLDDGEASVYCLLEFLEGKRKQENLKRIFFRNGNQVIYCDDAAIKDVPQKDTGTPDYSDLPLNEYLSVIEIVNPMHRLWSDGRWNKLTLAHGCYWGKCSFCDISLSYIKNYEPLTASLLCDRIETIIAQTGQNGFHFVDEAAPPKLMRELALEILRRKLTVVWWTNIRFEKTFTPDLARLLKASGCIAVSGGLEVASDRLLETMNKGVTVAQVARVADGFTRAGIMVHAYLMYGFPTQTAQETIDALEMVRQLFESGVLQSGFWHRFAMTSHAPIGIAPEKFAVQKTGPDFGGFADNDLYHDDPLGANHDLFSEGLRKSLFNYMHGVGFEFPLQKWFDMPVPKTKITPRYIETCLRETAPDTSKENAIVIWLGNAPLPIENGLGFFDKSKDWAMPAKHAEAEWLCQILPQISINNGKPQTLKQVKENFESVTQIPFDKFMRSNSWQKLRENGLLIL